ncbi:MAG: biotin--[acetyl-CoA-carboxylase] ligase [Saprospiraceae bacterium]
MEFPTLNFKYIHLESVDSTNKYLIDWVSKTAPEDGFCVFSDFQTDGRGQYGRNWQSNKGENLLSSFAFQTQWLNDLEVFILHQITSLCLLNVIRKSIPEAELRIKWPNDILVKDKKIAGILIQNIYRGQQLNWSIIGIGLNINQQAFDAQLQASSMSIIGKKEFDHIPILQDLHDEICKWIQVIKNNPELDLLDDYNDELYQLNQFVQFEKTDSEIVKGKLLGVDENGKIKIEMDNRIQSFDWSEIKIHRFN